MKNKNRKMQQQKQQTQQAQKQQAAVSVKDPGISKIGKKIIMAGVGLLIAGYFILTKTDPAGQNWASMVSPFLILGGYAAIGAGILYPEKQQNPA